MKLKKVHKVICVGLTSIFVLTACGAPVTQSSDTSEAQLASLLGQPVYTEIDEIHTIKPLSQISLTSTSSAELPVVDAIQDVNANGTSYFTAQLGTIKLAIPGRYDGRVMQADSYYKLYLKDYGYVAAEGEGPGVVATISEVYLDMVPTNRAVAQYYAELAIKEVANKRSSHIVGTEGYYCYVTGLVNNGQRAIVVSPKNAARNYVMYISNGMSSLEAVTLINQLLDALNLKVDAAYVAQVLTMLYLDSKSISGTDSSERETDSGGVTFDTGDPGYGVDRYADVFGKSGV